MAGIIVLSKVCQPELVSGSKLLSIIKILNPVQDDKQLKHMINLEQAITLQKK